MFQRPKRASVISTWSLALLADIVGFMFQRPKRASVISTEETANRKYYARVFQRPKRASVISTLYIK